MNCGIILSNGMKALVDDEDYGRLSNQKWTASLTRPVRGKYYARGRIFGGKNVLMHRLIMAAAPGQIVDHRDGNGLNNTRANLRFCTANQNSANARHPRAASGFIGVFWCPHRQCWRARISENGKSKNLPWNFEDAAEAARVRDAHVAQMYGEFAVLNFPAATEVSRPLAHSFAGVGG